MATPEQDAKAMFSFVKSVTTDIVVGAFINDMTKHFSLRVSDTGAGEAAVGWGIVENEAYLRPFMRWPFFSGFSGTE